ncbi:MAG: hypothetical protein QOG64_2556 [Acidimicrobiaceae bacterium]|nr:hypothetical protein [Acidimicrobiaceae bacterium]
MTLVAAVALVGAGIISSPTTAASRVGRPAAPSVGLAAAPVEPVAASAVAAADPAGGGQNFYFHGQAPSDDPGKITGPTATFDTKPPTGTAPVTQTATGVANKDSTGNPLAVFWYAPFTGTLHDAIEFRWYWSSSNGAAALGDPVTVSVFADPDLNAGTGTLVGRAVSNFAVTPVPALQISRVDVSGVVATHLLIQVTPNFSDAGEGTTATYDTTDFPSGFTYPAAPLPPEAAGPGVTFATDNVPAFAPATIASAHFLAGEPQTTLERALPTTPLAAGIDPKRIFIDWPLSTRTQIGQLSRSTDGGDSFRLILDPTCAPRSRPTCASGGGGDTEEAVNPFTGEVYFADQEALAQESLASSTDHGDTFPPARTFAATAAATGVDRQWLAAAPIDVPTTPFGQMNAFYAYHVPEAGQFIVGVDPSGIPHPPPVPQIQGVAQSGQLRVDTSNGPGHGWIYQPFNSSGFNVATANMANYIDPTAWTVHKVGPQSPSIFTWLSLDDHGNAYATWVSGGRVLYSYSQIDDPANNPTATPAGRPGTKWSPPVVISLPAVGSAIFSQSVAGAPGKLAVAYDGTSDFAGISDGPDNPDGSTNNFPNARWHTYVAIIDNGLAPAGQTITVRTGQVDHRIVHTGNICTSGTACAATVPPTGPAKDRSLLDLIDVGLDQDGRVGVTFTDNNSALQTPTDPNNPRESPFVHFAKETAGPSLLSDTPLSVTAPATNPVVDPPGDAKWPNTATGTNLESLDTLGASIGLDGTNVVAKINLADVTAATMAADLATYNASGTSVPAAERLQYVVRFSTGTDTPRDGRVGDVDFLSVDTTGNGTLRGFGGIVDANDAVTNGQSILGTGYHRDFDATVALDTTAKQLVITAPASKFGPTVGVGTRLFNVTGFAMAGPAEANEILITNVMRTVDATPPFDTTLAQPSSATQSGPIAALAVTPSSGGAPVAVTLDSSGSTPGSSPIISRTYDFGDGSPTVTTTADRVVHVYNQPGISTAKVTVTDANGTPAAATAVVTVRTGPTAAITGAPPSGNVPLDVAFDASGSTPGANETGGAATLTKFAWDFGDGSSTTTAGPKVTHRYGLPGVYHAVVVVTNSNGDAARSGGFAISVFPGYWMVAADGGIFTHGGAPFLGSMGDKHLNKPIVGMASTPTGLGYYMVASDGGIFTFGDAKFLGSQGGAPLNKPIVGMAVTPSGNGYWMAASDGGIFTFGDAKFLGSQGGAPLNKPVIGMASTPSGNGYFLVATDGGLFTFGDAKFLGSMGGTPLTLPVVGLAATRSGEGYWMDASDGGIFTFGDAPFLGSQGDHPLNQPVVGMAAL